MGCGCSCGKGNPVADPTSASEAESPESRRSTEATSRPVAAHEEHDEEDHARQNEAELAAQRERDEKARARRDAEAKRAALAKRANEQKHQEEMELADALEKEMDGLGESSSDESESSEEEDDMPQFAMGKRVKLRDPARGKMRRTKINLNSGYDVMKVAKIVEKDLEWQEPDESDEDHEEKPPLAFSVRLDMDFDDVDDENRAQFEEEVLQDIAEAAGVPKEALRVSALRKGSMIVDMTIEREGADYGPDLTADAVVLQLMAQVKDADSRLYQGKHTCRAMAIKPAEKLEDPATAKKKPEPQKIPLWRTVVLYICSSLEQDHGRGDLQDELEVLYHDVLPQLKTKYAQRMIHLLLVDPRMCCSEEPMSSEEAAEVIKTAAACMEYGQPPIVLALRGAKHGWVPASRQEVPADFQTFWRKRGSLQQLEIQVALQKAVCAIVYYRSKPGREESDEEDQHSSSDEREVVEREFVEATLPNRPHTIAAMRSPVGDSRQLSPEVATQRPHTIAGFVDQRLLDTGSDAAGDSADSAPLADTKGGGLEALAEEEDRLVGEESGALGPGNTRDRGAREAESGDNEDGTTAALVSGADFGHGVAGRRAVMAVGQNFGGVDGDGVDMGGSGEEASGIHSGGASRPTSSQSRRSIASRPSSSVGSSVGSEQAREELAALGDDVEQLVHGVVTNVVGDFPDSGRSRAGASASRPGSASSLRPNSAGRPILLNVNRPPSSTTRPLSSTAARSPLRLSAALNAASLDSARSLQSAPETPSSVGSQQARDELRQLDLDVEQLVGRVMSRTVHSSAASSPAHTRRSVGSSTGSVGTVQARDELARVGADMGDFVGDVLSGVLGACTNRSGSTVASGQAREELLQLDENVADLLDDVVYGVVDSFPSAPSGAGRPASALVHSTRSNTSSVGTVEGKRVLAKLGVDAGDLVDQVLLGVSDGYPDSSRRSSAPQTPLSQRPLSPGHEAQSRPESDAGATGDEAEELRRHAPLASSHQSPRDNLSGHGVGEQAADQGSKQGLQALVGDSVATTTPQRAASGSVVPLHAQLKVVVPEETDAEMLKRERRRLRRSDRVYLRHFEATFVAAQTRPSAEVAAQGDERTEDWDASDAAAAAADSRGEGRRRLTGQASWKKLKSAVEITSVFSANREAPAERVSPESLAEFAAIVRKDLEEVLDQVCNEWGQTEPLQNLIHKECEKEARQMAAQSPHATRVRAGMGPAKTRRMLERAAKSHKSHPTVPTFNELVSWQCHQKLWRRRSKELVGNGGRSMKQLLSKVREGCQTVLLLGQRGWGKTVLASRLVRRFSDMPEAGWIVLAHHAGAGNTEFSIRSVLRRFCGELSRHMQVHAPIPEGRFVDSHLRELLVTATSLYGANVLLVIDGYDQMDNVDTSASHTWIPQGEILGLQIVLTLEEGTACHSCILSRVDDYAEIRLAQLEENEIRELAEKQLSKLLPGFESTDLPIQHLVVAAQRGLRPPLWIVTACRVIKGLIELYGFTQQSPEEATKQSTPALSRAPSRFTRLGRGSFLGSRSQNGSRPEKVLVPGSTLHSTICDLIQLRWNKDWSDIAALLDSLVVAMEQVFPLDLVRDSLSLIVSSPAGLDQSDLLTLLGYGYPAREDDEDEGVSVNPSPQLSPRSPESPARGNKSMDPNSDEEHWNEEADLDQVTTTSTSAIQLQISAANFGCPLPLRKEDEYPESVEALRLVNPVTQNDRNRGGMGELEKRLVGPWARASRQASSLFERMRSASTARSHGRKLDSHGRLSVSSMRDLEGGCREWSRTSRVVSRPSRSPFHSLVVSGSSFGAADHSHHHHHHHHGHHGHGEDELHVGQSDHVQDSTVFTRLFSTYSDAHGAAGLLRCASSMSASMLVRVTSAISLQGEKLQENGEVTTDTSFGDSLPVTFLDYARLKAVLDSFLQDPLELHPAALRFADRSIIEILQQRLLSDEEITAEIHHHIADHLVLAAGGKWQESTGVVFAPQCAKLLGEHMFSIRWLPFHLRMAQCWTDAVQLLCDLHFLKARVDSAMLEGHIDDCAALSRTIEEELSVMEAMQLEKELKRGTTAAIRKTRTSGDEHDEDDVLMRQMAVLLNRILEMFRFLEGDRKVLMVLPKLTAQQAVNQPRGSIPELLAKVQLMPEPKGQVRYGKKSARAKAVEAEVKRTKKALHLYSPIAGYRAAQGGGNPGATERFEAVEEGEVEDEGVEEDELGEQKIPENCEAAVRPAESTHDAADGEEIDRFRRPDTTCDTASGQRKSAPEPKLEEEEEEEEEEIRYGVWIEHVNKGTTTDDGQTRMKMSFMHVAMSSDEVPSCGESVACVSGGNGTMRLYDVTTMLQIFEFSGHSDAVNMSTFNSSCDKLASASDDCTLRVWRLPEYDNINRRVIKVGECLRVLRGVPQGYPHGHNDAVTQCDFTPDGRVLVSASDDKTVKTWNIETGLIFRTLEGHAGWVTSIRTSPFRSQLISGGDDGMIMLWDIGFDPDVANPEGLARGGLLGTELAHSAPVVAMTFSPDGRFVASAAADCSLVVYQASSLCLLAKISNLPAPPLSVNFDCDAWRVWVLSDGGRLLIYDLDDKSAGAAQSPGSHGSPSSSLARSPAGSPRREDPSLVVKKKKKAKVEPLGTYFLPRMSGGSHYSVSPQAGNTCIVVCGDGAVTLLKLHNVVHKELPPPTPIAPPRPGKVRIKDDDDDTEEIEWEEFSGPLTLKVERVGGSDGRVSVHFSTTGTNDDDPDFVAASGILEWEHGDTEDKLICLGMRSYNGVEWDAQGCVRYTHPDSGEQLRLEGRLAEFGVIAFAEGYIAMTRPWHPPLANNADYMLLEAELEDAYREENTGTVMDDRRLVAARSKLKWAQTLGRDADVGLTNWTGLGNNICVLDPDCVPGTSKEAFADPEERRRVVSEFILKAAKIAHSVGAVGVVVPVPSNPDGSTTLDVARIPAPDIFDESTGKWDPDALDRNRVPIPVMSVAPPARSGAAQEHASPGGDDKQGPRVGLGRGVLRAGQTARIQPEAPNHAFYQRTGIKPQFYLDMAGDTDFELVLQNEERCELDESRAAATVRIVTREAKRARMEEGQQKAAVAAFDKEENEALAAEAAALKERQEADEAEAAYQEEQHQAKLAEQQLEAATVAMHEAEDAANRLRTAAEMREAQADSLQSTCSNGRLKLKELKQRISELAPIVKAQAKRKKSLLGGMFGDDADAMPEEEELRAATDEFDITNATIEEASRKLAAITEEMDDIWQEVENAQRLAEDRHADMFAAEIQFRKEKAEAELARMRRDKEVAEAEEAEANARRERAEAAAAREQARVAQEEADKALAREKAMREDFERRVAEAAHAMEKAEADRLSGAIAAQEAAAREQRKERERLLKSLAAQEEKRQLEAEAEAKVRAESEAKFKKMAEKREAEMQALRAQSGAAANGEDEADVGSEKAKPAGLSLEEMLKSDRFPWRRTRKALEPGYTRDPRPALCNDFLHVLSGWEGEKDDNRARRRPRTGDDDAGILDKRVLDATLQLPQHLRKGAATSLANSDYLQALKEWDQVDPTDILEGDTLKLSGRQPPELDRELMPVNLPTGAPTTLNTTQASLLGGATPMITTTPTATTPLIGTASAAQSHVSRPSTQPSRPGTSKVKFLEDDAPSFSRRPSADLTAVQERLVVDGEEQDEGNLDT